MIEMIDIMWSHVSPSRVRCDSVETKSSSLPPAMVLSEQQREKGVEEVSGCQHWWEIFCVLYFSDLPSYSLLSDHPWSGPGKIFAA